MQHFVVGENGRKKVEKMQKKVLTKGLGSGIVAKRSGWPGAVGTAENNLLNPKKPLDRFPKAW